MYAAGLGYELPVVSDEEGGEGKSVRDYKKAAAWFSRAVPANQKYAQYSLDVLYYRGQGVTQNYSQAFNFIRGPQSNEIPMPVTKWQRCTGTELEFPPTRKIRKVALNRHFPVSAD